MQPPYDINAALSVQKTDLQAAVKNQFVQSTNENKLVWIE
jgi:hypothetical protein